MFSLSPVGSRLVKGLGAQGGAQVLQVVLQLLSVPALLAAWGATIYADWLVLSAAAVLLVLADFGIVGHTSNALRAAWARGDGMAGDRILRTGLGVYVGMTGLTVAALIALVATVDAGALLGVNELDDSNATLLLLCLATAMAMPRGLVASIYSARGDFHSEVAYLALASAGSQGAAILTALAGGTPPEAALAHFIASMVLGWGALLWGLRRHHGDVSLLPAMPTWAEFRHLLSKAPLYAVHQGTFVLLTGLPVVLLAQWAPPAAIVVFTTARTYSGLVRQAAIQSATVLGLEMARMLARGDRSGARRLHRDAALPMGGAVGLLAGFAWVAGPAVFALWTHGDLMFDPWVGGVLLAGAVLRVPVYAPFRLMGLVDRPAVIARTQTAEVATMIALCWVLVPWSGPLGAALAITLAEICVTAPWLARAAGRVLGERMMVVAVHGWGAALAALASVSLAALVVGFVAPVSDLWGLAVFTVCWVLVAIPTLLATLPAGLRSQVGSILVRGRWTSPDPSAPLRLSAEAIHVDGGDGEPKHRDRSGSAPSGREELCGKLGDGAVRRRPVMRRR